MRLNSRLWQTLQTWTDAGLAFLYPEVCQLCRQARATPKQGFVCVHCRDQVRFIQPPYCRRCGFPYEGDISHPFECTKCRNVELYFQSARSAVRAEDPVLEAIHQYKYNRAVWFEPFLVDLLLAQAVKELRRADWDWIIPIPLYPLKEREREFNQAQRLAAPLSRITGIPLNEDLLRRSQPTRTQTRLSREERLANVRDAFGLCHPGSLDGQRFVLIDDVFTTGATTNACARVLHKAGASAVCVWTLARGI